ncbi:hypothetical protein [Shewanella colwelliana]|uniref:DUF3325 domain-containing protein n=2 Tax=Shewanella colwelliana TaxID=23 RepID=A0ABQ4P5T6_SHECO|nr:hypothetical protein [Shewanella colwelliana]GIU42870.1 hypothetical protein TUM3794_27220 [Shewanella colwelliana]
MLNLAVLPFMPIVGAMTANLSQLIRGENTRKISVGLKTFITACAAFASVWFLLLVTAIYTGGDTNTAAGVEVLALFVAGLAVFSIFKLDRFIGERTQVWLYRLALPIMVISCLTVSLFG